MKKEIFPGGPVGRVNASGGTMTMAQQDLEVLMARLAAIQRTVVALLVLGFGAGVWATTIQSKISALEKWQGERAAAIDEYQVWRRDVAQKIGNIDAKLDLLIQERRVR